MLSIIIPTLNAAAGLEATLKAIEPAADAGMVAEVIIVDGGSTDATRALAQAKGARLVSAERGRGTQLAAGAQAARSDRFLFLHADTQLAPGWWREVAALDEQKAAAFRFALDQKGMAARMVEAAVRLRCFLFALPYGDQGLVISRALYQELGGYRPLPLMEDVDLVRKIGRQRLTMLTSKATTSAQRYRQRGFLPRIARNFTCLSLYYLGVSPQRIARIYE